MTLALLCSGQGPQHPAMFAVTGDAPAAARLFDHAAALLGGRDPRALVRDADDATLHGNRVGQVLCTLQAVAALAALPGLVAGRRIVAGYSVGELGAWAAAGLIRPEAALDLAVARAAAMDAASEPGDGLLFVRGLGRGAVDRLCGEHGGAVAIVNPGDALVLGGSAGELTALEGAARAAGAGRVVRVGVRVASHTARLAAASTAFRDALSAAEVATRVPPGVRLLSGVDAAPVLDVWAGLDKLARQISTTIRWADGLAAAVEAGASAFLELGPGRALAEMASAAHPGVPARSLDDFRSADGARDWIGRVAV
ncbi:acyltransferase domain-containing protein [Lichenibacterium minor]|uniref:Acyltransferase domain-containing protein n=1 Tax=Lichenibacterium minor TaxID=2316528 RepID=A0A4Q2U9D3_9HYPH|nr:acyltransferase domain-containing protein [Lichenibacterium minor]RYC33140.1 acyltransferase domain-containing protein [Lichenibacterium minor]